MVRFPFRILILSRVFTIVKISFSFFKSKSKNKQTFVFLHNS